MEDLLVLPFLNSKYCHTSKMMDGLLLYLDWGKTAARKQKRADLADGRDPTEDLANDIDIFIDEWVTGKKKSTQAGKEYRRAEKLSADADTLESVAEPSLMKDVVVSAIVHLEALAAYLFSEDAHLGWNWRKVANTLMVGIIFWSTIAGRPGEWASLKIKE